MPTTSRVDAMSGGRLIVEAETFDTLVTRLQHHRRPIQVIKRADEDTLWAAYHLAHFTVFPSLTEGFGLPVAESLATATPTITSNFGSMAEIARDGGALTIDPRTPPPSPPPWPPCSPTPTSTTPSPPKPPTPHHHLGHLRHHHLAPPRRVLGGRRHHHSRSLP